jgi:hypothetical protein
MPVVAVAVGDALVAATLLLGEAVTLAFAAAGALLAPGLPACSLASNSSTRFSNCSTRSNSNCSRSVKPLPGLVAVVFAVVSATGVLLGLVPSSAQTLLQNVEQSKIGNANTG